MDSRDIAAKPVKSRYTRTGMGWEYHDWECPACGTFLAFEPAFYKIPRRCQQCGQLLAKLSQEDVEND